MTSRLVADIPIVSGDAIGFMKALDYSYDSVISSAGEVLD